MKIIIKRRDDKLKNLVYNSLTLDQEEEERNQAYKLTF
jgi:hypothetical protein